MCVCVCVKLVIMGKLKRAESTTFILGYIYI